MSRFSQHYYKTKFIEKYKLGREDSRYADTIIRYLHREKRYMGHDVDRRALRKELENHVRMVWDIGPIGWAFFFRWFVIPIINNAIEFWLGVQTNAPASNKTD
ncbi:MAG: hypothetical protein KDA84_12615 [Planctomycetaceae bacterium]|nr:hypothetical protein [Planctomycetaceae bacterium]